MAVVIVMLAAIAFAPQLERSSSGPFATLKDARNAGLAERGWIPGLFPDCLENVRISTDPDTNRAFYSFELPQNCR